MNTSKERLATAAATTLIILQTVMLLSLYSRTFPHPPETVAPFGIAPFLGASLSFAAIALIFQPTQDRIGRVFGVLAALSALVSYGPQKYFDAQIGFIWPSVVIGQLAAVTLIVVIWQARNNREKGHESGHNLPA